MAPGAAFNPNPDKGESSWEDLSLRNRTSGVRSFVFADKASYAFGLPTELSNSDKHHGAFKLAHEVLLRSAQSPQLRALRAFVTNWSPDMWERFSFPVSAIGDERSSRNFAFRLKGEELLLHEHPEAEALCRAVLEVSHQTSTCILTGCDASIVASHPQFYVAGAQSSGASLVSFNLGGKSDQSSPSSSYGKEQGANAPVSESAAFKYGAALNWLLDRNNARSFRLGETTVVFWADDREANVGEEAATEAEKAFWAEFGTDIDAEPEPDADADDAAAIGAELQKVKALRGPPDLAKLQPNTRVHVLGLSPNAGRIAVRFWLVDTFGHLEENLKHHKRDMAIEPPDPRWKLTAYALLKETAVLRETKNIPPRLGGELARAILTGGRYPSTLLSAVVGRIRADKDINAARAAICKAVINRDHDEEVIPVALDPQNLNPAYRLGRLFALIEGAQKAALPKLNATVKDRYFGSACATPARVFPLLHKNAMNHIAAVRKEKGGGLAHWLEAEIGQIWSGLSDDLPRALRLEEQGRFIAGYYHQRFSKTAATPAEAQTILSSDTEGDDQ